MSRKFFVKDTDYAPEDTAGVVKVGSGLSVSNEGVLSTDNSGTSGSCIVCSPTQPTDLKKGLWIETEDSGKDINIIGSISINSVMKKTLVDLSRTLDSKMGQSNALGINGIAYIFAGGTKVRCYDPKTDILTFKEVSINLSSGGGCCLINDKVYFIKGGSKTSNAEILVYDYITNTVSNKQLTYKLSGAFICSIDSKLYILGGKEYSTSRSEWYFNTTVRCYDSTTETITSHGSLSKTFINGAVCSTGKKILLIGGNQGTSGTTSGDPSNSIMVYDTQPKHTFIDASMLSYKQIDSSACAIGENVYIFGGNYSNEGSTNIYTTNAIQCYNTTFGNCREILKLNHSISRAGVCVIDGKIYILGGT